MVASLCWFVFVLLVLPAVNGWSSSLTTTPNTAEKEGQRRGLPRYYDSSASSRKDDHNDNDNDNDNNKKNTHKKTNARSLNRNSNNNENSNVIRYQLAPFIVSFTTTTSTTNYNNDDEERQQQHPRYVFEYPLRIITGEFLLESFRIQLAKSDDNDDDDIQQTDWNTLWTLQSLDLTVVLYNNDNDQYHEVDNNHRMMNNDHGDHLLHFWAQFEATATFLAPLSGGEGERTATTTAEPQQLQEKELQVQHQQQQLQQQQQPNPPTNHKNISDILGVWMDMAFTEDLEYYVSAIHNASRSYPVLQNIVHLSVATDEYYSINSSAKSSDQSDTAWTTKLERTLLFAVLLLIITLVLRQGCKRRSRRSGIEKIHFEQPSHSDPEIMDNAEMCNDIAGRHGNQILTVLEHSDRWLSQHRPEVFDAMQQDASYSSFVALPGSKDKLNSDKNNCKTPNLQITKFLLRPFVGHNRTKQFNRQNSVNSIDSSWTSSVCDGWTSSQRTTFKSTTLSNFRSWCQQRITQASLRFPGGGRREDPGDDKDVIVLPLSPTYRDFEDDDAAGAVGYENTHRYYHQDHPDELLHIDDEDLSELSFAFQDFPRRDGTPCLIYNDDSVNDPQQGSFVTIAVGDGASPENASHHPQPPPPDTHPWDDKDHPGKLLSNEAFQNALEDQNTSFVQDEDGNDTDNTKEKETKKVKEVLFLSKLERIVAVRHRHYERDAIMGKHRDARQRERKEKKKHQEQLEMDQRDKLFKQHSFEREIQELEKTCSPASCASHESCREVSHVMPSPSSHPLDLNSQSERIARRGHRSVRSFPNSSSLFVAAGNTTSPLQTPTADGRPPPSPCTHMKSPQPHDVPLRRHSRSLSLQGDAPNNISSFSEDVLLHGIYTQHKIV